MYAVRLTGLRYRYPPECFAEPAAAPGDGELFAGLSLAIEAGSRVLLVGANGVGKSTLLRLIAGQHLLPPGMLEVFGRSPFDSGFSLSELTLVDGDFPVDVDLRVSELLAHPSPGVDPASERQLLELLEVQPRWRMHRVSEGQRRRVQLALALRRPVRLLLLDEVTSHLDVVARADLLDWLGAQSRARGMTVIYTTHILDRLCDRPGDAEAGWPTHLAFLSARGQSFYRPIADIAELRPLSLSRYCEQLLRHR